MGVREHLFFVCEIGKERMYAEREETRAITHGGED